MSNTCETCDTYVCDHVEKLLDDGADLMNQAADMLDTMRDIVDGLTKELAADDE